jgi:asparagine synthase (glutamine-hydrolysing)
MCGFAGYAGEREYDTSVIRKMTDKIRHRGPDSQDAFVEGKVGLGFVRGRRISADVQ